MVIKKVNIPNSVNIYLLSPLNEHIYKVILEQCIVGFGIYIDVIRIIKAKQGRKLFQYL